MQHVQSANACDVMNADELNFWHGRLTSLRYIFCIVRLIWLIEYVFKLIIKLFIWDTTKKKLI